MPNTILRIPQVRERTGLRNSQLYKLISDDKFPRQIKLGPRASGWIEAEVDKWIENKITESRNQNAA